MFLVLRLHDRAQMWPLHSWTFIFCILKNTNNLTSTKYKHSLQTVKHIITLSTNFFAFLSLGTVPYDYIVVAHLHQNIVILEKNCSLFLLFGDYLLVGEFLIEHEFLIFGEFWFFGVCEQVK